MIAAAEQKVDAIPTAGFVPKQVNKILNLKSEGLKSVALLPLGYQAEDGSLTDLKKVRTPEAESVTVVE